MIDLSNYKDYLSDKAHRVLTSAIEESQKRQHHYLGVEHIFLAIAEVEKGLFAEIADKLNFSPRQVIHSLQEYLNSSKQVMVLISISGFTKKVLHETPRFICPLRVTMNS